MRPLLVKVLRLMVVERLLLPFWRQGTPRDVRVRFARMAGVLGSIPPHVLLPVQDRHRVFLNLYLVT